MTEANKLKIVGAEELESQIYRLTADEATKTFILVGAGAAQSDKYSPELRLPLASKLRDTLLKSYYGPNIDTEKCLERFKKESKFENPTPDLVWQYLIRETKDLQKYTELLNKEFSLEKPIPPSYHMLARWFFASGELSSGIATTNFDIQFSKAFSNLAQSLNKRQSIDFNFADLPQDFRYFYECKIDYNKVVQMLHGSLIRPWSIVAGTKEIINDLTNSVREYSITDKKNPFELLKQIVETLNPENSNLVKNNFFPYKYLEKTLSKSLTVIFIGYSFQDRELVSAIENGCSSHKDIYIVDPDPPLEKINSLSSFRKATVIKSTAEDFLHKYVQKLLPEDQLIQLPYLERKVLREGPENIPGHPKLRLIPNLKKGRSTEFVDPIYGTFKFSDAIQESLLKLIDTGEVQRLRQIKQLSFVNLKYHGATHDRFTHSLGVAHLADLFISNWVSNRNKSFPERIKIGDHLAFITCALIHDIGHGPFGHAMDLVRYKINDPSDHEADTTKIFNQIFSENSFADLDIALDQLEIARTKINEILGQKESKGIEKFLHTIINNTGCDIDRLDFVLRDTSSTLMSWDNPDKKVKEHFDILLENYTKLLYSMRFTDDLVLTFDKSSRDYLESFTFLYLKLYKEVYYCWQNVAAQAMLAEAVAEMIHSRKLEFSDIKPLTDVELLAALENFEHPKVSELAYLVKYRRLFKLQLDTEISDSELGSIKKMTSEEIVEKFGKGLKYIDGMLVVSLPSKEVKVNFFAPASGVNSTGGNLFADDIEKDVVIGRNNARLMVFTPPKGY